MVGELCAPIGTVHMTKPTDDFEAVRILVDALTPFENQDRERIIRWAREKLGMAGNATPSITPVAVPGSVAAAVPADAPHAATAVGPGGAQDIRSFMTFKNPKTEAQLVATVAYYYRFMSPPHERKETITGADVVEACRQADRKRPVREGKQAMINAFTAGVVDRVDGGKYKLNTVGENLVAVVLGNGTAQPDAAGARSRSGRKRKAKGAKKARK